MNLTPGRNQPSSITSNKEIQTGTWKDAVLAGLPHFMMGLCMGSAKLLSQEIYQNSQFVSAVVIVILAFLVVMMLFTAYRGGWPLWSASWYMYGTWVILVIIGLGIEKLNLQESWRYTNFLFISWIFLCIVGYFYLHLKSPIKGLLAIAFLFPFLGILSLEFIPNPIEGWLTFGLGTFTAVTAGIIVRRGSFRFTLIMVLVVSVIAGILLAYVGEYQIKDLPAGIPAHIPHFNNFLRLLSIYGLIGVGIIAFPLILGGFWHFVKPKLISWNE